MIRKSKSGEEIKHIIVPFTLIDTKTITEKDSKGVSKKYFNFNFNPLFFSFIAD